MFSFNYRIIRHFQIKENNIMFEMHLRYPTQRCYGSVDWVLYFQNNSLYSNTTRKLVDLLHKKSIWLKKVRFMERNMKSGILYGFIY